MPLPPKRFVSRSSYCGGIFDWDQAKLRLSELNALAGDPGLWNDQDQAQAVLRERTQLEKSIAGVERLTNELNEAVDLIELGEAEGAKEVVAEAEATRGRLKQICQKKKRQQKQ